MIFILKMLQANTCYNIAVLDIPKITYQKQCLSICF